MRNLLWGVILFVVVGSQSCKTTTAVPTPTTPSVPTLTTLVKMPSEVDESSGLWLAENMWSHNDSGEGALLFEMSMTKKKLLRTVTVNNATSRDWEDITADENYVYIGDFGNNVGDRMDLAVFRIDKASLLSDTETVDAEKIAFHYPEQTVFNTGAYEHNFDCEAMIANEDYLYLFTKNHLNKACDIYQLEKSIGDHPAYHIGHFDVEGTVTAADWDKDRNILALLGYNVYYENGFHFTPFLYLLYDFEGVDFLSGKQEKIVFDVDLQMEGVASQGDGVFILSTEAESGGDAHLYTFDVKPYLK